MAVPGILRALLVDSSIRQNQTQVLGGGFTGIYLGQIADGALCADDFLQLDGFALIAGELQQVAQGDLKSRPKAWSESPAVFCLWISGMGLRNKE